MPATESVVRALRLYGEPGAPGGAMIESVDDERARCVPHIDIGCVAVASYFAKRQT